MAGIKTPVELGAVIRDARERHKWTQSDLAQRANVTRQWVIRMEKGRHDKAEMGLVLAVLNVLGVPLYAGGQAEPPQPPTQAGPPQPPTQAGPPQPPTLAEPAARLVGHIEDARVDLDAVIAMAMGD